MPDRKEEYEEMPYNYGALGFKFDLSIRVPYEFKQFLAETHVDTLGAVLNYIDRLPPELKQHLEEPNVGAWGAAMLKKTHSALEKLRHGGVPSEDEIKYVVVDEYILRETADAIMDVIDAHAKDKTLYAIAEENIENPLMEYIKAADKRNLVAAKSWVHLLAEKLYPGWHKREEERSQREWNEEGRSR